MSVELWWNDTDRETHKYLGRTYFAIKIRMTSCVKTCCWSTSRSVLYHVLMSRTFSWTQGSRANEKD